MLEPLVRLHLTASGRVADALARRTDRVHRLLGSHERGIHAPDRDRGQATTEYALVMLGAAVVALLVVTWATAGGGAGKIGRLFDKVIDAVTDKI